MRVLQVRQINQLTTGTARSRAPIAAPAGAMSRAARLNWLLGSVSAVALAAALGTPAAAQSWTDGTGNWNVNSNWGNNPFPNSAAASATVNNGGTANVNTGITVGTLTIGSGSGVGINDNQSLTIDNSIANSGVVSLNSAGNTTNLILGGASVSLTGGGQIVLNNQFANRIYGAVGTDVLDNVDNTISGAGQLGVNQLTLINEAAGVIDANQSTRLEVQLSGGATNAGMMEATAGGTLRILNSTINSSSGGTIQALAGSAVNLDGATLTGGTLATSGTGVIQNVSVSTLDGTAGNTVTNTGHVQVDDNTRLNIQGVINNTGSITLNSAGNSTDLEITGGAAKLQGGGQLVLNDHASNLVFGATASAVLTNVNNTISGAGQLGDNQLTLINQATINATGGNALVVSTGQGGPVQNTGLMEATNTGGLTILNTTVDNTGNSNAGQIVANGGNVLLSGGTIRGGTITTPSGDVQTSGGGNHLDGSAAGAPLNNAGTVAVTDNTNLALEGTINNTGTIALRSAGNTTDLIANSATVTLTGGGQVTMNDHGSNRIYGASASNVLDNVNNTISGGGQLGAGQLTLKNEASGVIDASSASTTLHLNTSANVVINNGLIEGTGAGQLQIEGGTAIDSSSGGTILAGAGSGVALNGATLTGGTLKTAAGAAIYTAGGVDTLDGTSGKTLNNTGLVQVSDNNTLNLQGVINNTGTLAVNSNGNTTTLELTSSKVTLQGGGQVVLNNHTSNFIYGASGADTLLNVDNTISGGGQLGDGQMTLTNQATINANQSSALVLNTAGNVVTNSGLLEATSSGGLTIAGGTDVDSSSGGTVTGTGGPGVVLNNATLTGGTLTGLVQTSGGTNVLDGTAGKTLTNKGTVQVNDNQALRLQGVISNTGSITLASGGNTTELFINSPTVTLQGGGQVVLNNHTSNFILGAVAADTLLNVDNTISGGGQIGDGQMTLINQATINANQSSALVLNTAGNVVTNSGLIEATSSGGLTIAGGTDVDSSSGGTVTGTGGPGVVLNNATLTGGTLTGLVQTSGGTNVLDGTAGKTLTNKGTVQVNDNQALRLQGVISNTGSITLASGGNTTELFINSPTVTLQGGGQVVLNNHASNDILAAAAGNTLNNVDNTISGAGQLGDGTDMPLLNGGTVNANQSNTLFVNIGGAASTNTGLMEGTGSGGLVLQNGSYTNNGTVQAGDGSSVTYQPSAINANASGGTLTGGTWNAIANGHGATLAMTGGPITTDAANMTLSGAGSVIEAYNGSSYVDIQNSLTNIATGGKLHVLNGQNYTTSTMSNAISNAGLVDLGGGTFTDASFSNTGSLSGFGKVTNTGGGPVSNSGQVTATGGNLVLSQGVTGTTGNVTISKGASLDISGASAGNTVATLLHNGSNLNLGSQNITVNSDYNNANFGSGNSFNNHANVTGSGSILAAGTGLQMSVSGTGVTGGTTSSPGLALNVHTNSTNSGTFDINWAGTNAPVLRGGVQTTSALAVSAPGFGPIAAGGSQAETVTLTGGATAGALTGQTLTVKPNFDNVQAQTIAVTGGAYNLANPNTIAPINIVAHTGDGGGSVSQALTIQNISLGNNAFQEGLNANFGGFSAGAGNTITPTLTGSITNLLAGGTDSSSMKVAISTASAGVFNGTVTVDEASNGAGTSGLGITALPSQHVAATGSVTVGTFNYAVATVNNTQPISFGNVRQGSSVANQAISVSNTGPVSPFTEALDGSVVSAPTGFTATNSFTGLQATSPPSSNTSISVGMKTSTAGKQTGNVVLGFVSDGTGIGGDGTTTPLSNQNVAVTGAVYRLADPTLNTPAVTLAARVGQTAPTANVSVTNTSPDSFTEALKASFGTAPTGFTNTGSIGGSGLTAQGTDASSLAVGLASTKTSGITTGLATVTFVSTGAGTDNAADISDGSANVSLTGKVYQTAVASVTPSVGFGIVHVGDTATPQTVTVSNTASGALVDSIVGTMNVSPSPFSVVGGGSLGSGVAAGGNSGSALKVGLNTATAGVYTGSANLSLSSHDSDLGDKALTTSPVALSATVNNYAAVGLAGATKGTLTGGGSAYTLNLGTLTKGNGSISAVLTALNAALGPADALSLGSGGFSVLSGVGEFGLTVNAFSDLAAGNTQANALDVSLNTSNSGTFDEVIQFAGVGSNGSGWNSGLNVLDPTLTIEASVSGGSGPPSVPEPSSWLVMLSALAGLGGIRRPWRRRRAGTGRVASAPAAIE